MQIPVPIDNIIPCLLQVEMGKLLVNASNNLAIYIDEKSHPLGLNPIQWNKSPFKMGLCNNYILGFNTNSIDVVSHDGRIVQTILLDINENIIDIDYNDNINDTTSPEQNDVCLMVTSQGSVLALIPTSPEQQIEQFLQHGLVDEAHKILSNIEPTKARLDKFYANAGFALMKFLSFPSAFDNFLRSSIDIRHILQYFDDLRLSDLSHEKLYGKVILRPNIKSLISSGKKLRQKLGVGRVLDMNDKELAIESRWYLCAYLWKKRESFINNDVIYKEYFDNDYKEEEDNDEQQQQPKVAEMKCKEKDQETELIDDIITPLKSFKNKAKQKRMSMRIMNKHASLMSNKFQAKLTQQDIINEQKAKVKDDDDVRYHIDTCLLKLCLELTGTTKPIRKGRTSALTSNNNDNSLSPPNKYSRLTQLIEAPLKIADKVSNSIVDLKTSIIKSNKIIKKAHHHHHKNVYHLSNNNNNSNNSSIIDTDHQFIFTIEQLLFPINYCKIDICYDYLIKQSYYHQLALLYRSKANYNDALNIWKKIATGEYKQGNSTESISTAQAIEYSISLLKQLPQDDSLLWTYSTWILQYKPNQAIEIFIYNKRIPSAKQVSAISLVLDFNQVITYLSNIQADLSAIDLAKDIEYDLIQKYLHFLIYIAKDTNELHHNQLAELYINKIKLLLSLKQDQLDQTEEEEELNQIIQKIRTNLYSFLKQSKSYNFHHILSLIKEISILKDELIVIYTHLHDHDNVLNMYLFELNDHLKAITYCQHICQQQQTKHKEQLNAEILNQINQSKTLEELDQITVHKNMQKKLNIFTLLIKKLLSNQYKSYQNDLYQLIIKNNSYKVIFKEQTLGIQVGTAPNLSSAIIIQDISNDTLLDMIDIGDIIIAINDINCMTLTIEQILNHLQLATRPLCITFLSKDQSHLLSSTASYDSIQSILTILQQYHQYINMIEIINLLPDEFPLATLYPYFKRSIPNIIHQQRTQSIVKNLNRVNHLRTHRQVAYTKSTAFLINDNTTCHKCGLKLGRNNAVFVVVPIKRQDHLSNDALVTYKDMPYYHIFHYNCLKQEK